MRALSLLLRRAAVAGPSVPAETSALGSGLSGLERFFSTRTLPSLAPEPYEDSYDSDTTATRGCGGPAH